MTKFFWLMFGGGLGTVCRYLVSSTVHRLMDSRFPYGTLSVNLLGCFIIGFLVVLMDKKFLLLPNQKLFLTVGFLGAFTTFSTFIMETAALIRAGQSLLAFGNIIISVVIGFAAFRFGVLLAEII